MEWNTDTTNILKFHKNFLGIIGLWVLNEKNVFSRIRWFLSTLVEVSYASSSIQHNLLSYIFVCVLKFVSFISFIKNNKSI